MIRNEKVQIKGGNKGGERLFNWLRKQHFNLGIAEIGSITGGFALFNELGISNTIATSATPAIPAFYHFLGLEIPYEVPGECGLAKIIINLKQKS